MEKNNEEKPKIKIIKKSSHQTEYKLAGNQNGAETVPIIHNTASEAKSNERITKKGEKEEGATAPSTPVRPAPMFAMGVNRSPGFSNDFALHRKQDRESELSSKLLESKTISSNAPYGAKHPNEEEKHKVPVDSGVLVRRKAKQRVSNTSPIEKIKRKRKTRYSELNIFGAATRVSKIKSSPAPPAAFLGLFNPATEGRTFFRLYFEKDINALQGQPVVESDRDDDCDTDDSQIQNSRFHIESGLEEALQEYQQHNSNLLSNIENYGRFHR